MKTKLIAIVLLAYGGCLYCPGCGLTTEEKEALQTYEGQRVAMELLHTEVSLDLVALREHGVISDKDWKTIQITEDVINRHLQDMYDADKDGVERPELLVRIQKLLDTLQSFLLEYKQ